MKNKRIVEIICIIMAVIILLGGFAGYKFIKHEKNQNERISQLQGDVSLLKSELELLKNSDKVEYSDTAYNYLAIGNSITKHGLADYWWNEIGMAATSEDKDYVHLITAGLEKSKGSVCEYAFNFYTWESQATDRAETFELLAPYLDERLNLVTIQLSENVSDTSTFESDFEELIDYIKSEAPDAQVIVIDDFWSDGDKSTMKKQAAENKSVQFVSLEEIKGDADYQCGIGTVVYDADGNEHVVEHDGVASHPGDLGMKYIAEEVLKVIN